jgi:hypothetical protein
MSSELMINVRQLQHSLFKKEEEEEKMQVHSLKSAEF